MGESDGKVRRYSLLRVGHLDAAKSSTQLNLKHALFLTHRFESTATASDASATPPVEKYEYQAEACSLELETIILIWNLNLSAYIYRLPYIFGVLFFMAGESSHGPHCQQLVQQQRGFSS